jgi:polyprenyldihydroxybenzoate methyltransferase / 3-demethylubiquinol 3-O-methyltransferase
MSISSPARNLNLRLLASLLQPTAAHIPLPRSAPAPTIRRPYSTTQPRPQDVPPSSTSSVSETEVSHFSRLASSWWDPHGPSRLLHLMNPLRHDFIKSCLQSSPEPTDPGRKYTYLDIGCGGGIFSSSAARLPSTRSVTAIDPTPAVIEIAKAYQRSDPALSEPKLRYLNCAIEDLPLSPSANNTSEPAGTDIITLFEVLEHIDSPSRFLKTTIPHLKPGGWLFGSTIARSPLSFLTTKVIAEAPLIGIVPRGTHDWNKYINPDELADWFEKDGGGGKWAPRTQGIIYVPGWGWKMVSSIGYGNYFFGVQKLL